MAMIVMNFYNSAMPSKIKNEYFTKNTTHNNEKKGVTTSTTKKKS